MPEADQNSNAPELEALSKTPPVLGGPTLEELKAEADATAAELAKHEEEDKADRSSAQKPSMGRIVIVRTAGQDYPGIVIGVRKDGSVDVQLFKGDHMPHARHGLKEKTGQSGDGWYWPPRV
jgi:hypothetical protein